MPFPTRRGALLLGSAITCALGAQLVVLTRALAQAPEATAPPAASTPQPSTVSTITVVGHRAAPMAALSRPVGPNQYVLTKGDLGDALSGDNALALVKDVPGVSYTATDALGVDASDVSLFVRGFHMNEMAVTFEGVPMNDTSFESLTGTSLVNVGVPDAIGSVQIAPGSAKESTFSNSDNGGGLVYALSATSAHPSLSLSQSYGSNATLVTSLSGQTGQLGSNGPEVLADFQRISADKYEGGGDQLFLRGDLKLKQEVPWGDFTLFFSGSHAEVWGYDNLSFAMIKNLGQNADISYPNYAKAYTDTLPQNANASCGVYTCRQLSFLEPYDTGQTTSDYIGSLAHDFRLTSAPLSGAVQVYGASSATGASLADPTTPSATGAPFSEEVQTPHLTRYGGTANLKYVVGRQTLTAGLWVEHTASAAVTSWYNEPSLGEGAPLRTIGPYDTYGPAFQVENESRWRTSSRQAYLHDDIAVTDTLTLGAGFKAVDFSTVGGGIGPDPAPYGALRANNAFLPHLSAFWKPDTHTDVFADVAETEIGYRVAERGNIGYSASIWTVSDQSAFDVAAKSLHPETDWNFTVGVAHRFAGFSLTYDAYYSLIDNRLLSAAIGSQFAQVNTVAAVPHSHIVGTDLGLTANVLEHFHIYQGVSASRFYYDDDLDAQGTIYPIKGDAQPAYPIYSLVSDLSFTYQAVQVGLNSTEYLRQPFSYENDVYGPIFWQVNAHASYTLRGEGAAPTLVFRLDASNLLNRFNIGTLDVGGSPFSGDYQTLQRSAPRQFLFTVSARY